ncbi:hypothetical protein ARNL5_01308 [Anaerolineae bacterium]|nr:hypothetical protein ARNL5_01308 [Anaerolineae bacterium]
MAAKTTTLEQVFAQAQALSPLDRVRLAERLFALIERDVQSLTHAEAENARLRAWQATIDRTAGALAEDPLERLPQGDFEQRDQVQ